MTSAASTVDEYLAELPPDRRAAIETVRAAILRSLPPGYEERMQYGMIGYCVPHSLFPDGYHCDPKQPLPFASLASQKAYMSLYLMCAYGSDELKQWFAAEWAAAGKKLDMGKSCVRFKRVEDLSLDVIERLFARIPVEVFVANYVRQRDQPREPRPKR